MITIRRARLADVPRMLPLLNEYTRQAEILPRTEDDIYRSIREWVVAEKDDIIVGTGSLLVMWHDLAEVRSLTVSEDCHGQGVGRRMVELLVEDARQMNIPRVIALTRKPAFFLKLGFNLTHIEQLPRKVKRDCVFCPKFHACDEAAVELWLQPPESVETQTGDHANAVDQVNGHPTQTIIPLLSKQGL